VRPGGYAYIGELHPFKQYTGSKAKFDTSDGENIVTCFIHHVSDFMHVAMTNGFELCYLHEYFDEDIRPAFPRIMALLLKKK